VILSTDAIEGFTPDAYTVTGPHEWICPLEVPAQIDRLDPDAPPELSFMAASGAEYQVHVGGHEPARQWPARTAVAEWPRNIGWESTRAAYRWYDGQLDFFGRHAYGPDGQPDDRLIFPVDGANYHVEQEWGMDALHVGATSGLGGLTLYVGDEAHPIQNPRGEGHVRFTARPFVAGPVRAAVEVIAENIIPGEPTSARILYIIYAGQRHTEVRVELRDAPEGALLAPGLIKLPASDLIWERDHGVLGTWGVQEEAIGEIGLGVLVPPTQIERLVELDDEWRVLCRPEAGRLKYRIIGDWRKGRRFDVAPGAGDWRRELVEMAGSAAALLIVGPVEEDGPQ
jgi:hypothetical protein